MLALLIVLTTVALVIWSPRGFGPARAATLGAVVALLSGSVQLRDLSTIWSATWNATLTLVGLITLSLVLDAAGVFRWAAPHVARAGGGHGRRLFVLLIVFAALLAAFFANDGGVLILTPIALELCAVLKFEAAANLAFAFATGFVVDAASLPFTFSNLTNIVTADAFHLTFTGYAKIMLPVDLAVVAACIGVLLLYFARALPRNYDLTKLEEPHSAIRSPGIFRLAWLLLPLLLWGRSCLNRSTCRSQRWSAWLPPCCSSPPPCHRSCPAAGFSGPRRGMSSSSLWRCTPWSTACRTPGSPPASGRR